MTSVKYKYKSVILVVALGKLLTAVCLCHQAV